MDQPQTKDQQAEQEEAELSLDQLDDMILSEAPEFAAELKEVKSLPSDGSIDLDVVNLDGSFPDVENPWKDATGVRKVLVRVFPFIPKLWEIKYNFQSNLHLRHARLRNVIFEMGPKLWHAIKAGSLATVHYTQGRIEAFNALTKLLKLAALALILLAVLTGVLIYRSVTQGVLPPDKEFLMASLEEWAVQTYKYDPETEMDSFYDSPRTIQNIMALSKMVVNLRPSRSSGSSPMAALEFFLEGLSPEAIVEVKDRESEIRDLFQRTLEEMTYGEMESTEGKQQLTERLRLTLNSHLTKGKIRRVYIKELVLKP